MIRTTAVAIAIVINAGALAEPLDDPKPVKTLIVTRASTLKQITGWPAASITSLNHPPAAQINLPHTIPPGWSSPERTYQSQRVVLGYEPGGLIHQHFERFLNIRASGAEVEVTNECNSACTLITNIFPKDKLCFGPRAVLGFHKAHYADGKVSMEDTRRMYDAYPADIQAWIDARGGIEKLPFGYAARPMYWLLPASELWKMGYRKCPD